jgi:hypothetical protein
LLIIQSLSLSLTLIPFLLINISAGKMKMAEAAGEVDSNAAHGNQLPLASPFAPHTAGQEVTYSYFRLILFLFLFIFCFLIQH